MAPSRVDQNQGPIVEALRKAGYPVEILSRFRGHPCDLMVRSQRFAGIVHLAEVKAPGEPLTPREKAFGDVFPVYRLETPEGAIALFRRLDYLEDFVMKVAGGVT